MTTFLCNMVYILIQIILLKKDFHPVQFLQIAANFLFSWLIDLSMGILDFFQPEALWARILSLLAGCLILGLGISIEVAPDTIAVPGEGIVRAIARTTGFRFGSVKVGFDLTLIVIAVVLSFLFFGRLNGIGAGTVVSALVVGRIVNVINRRLPLIGWIRSFSQEQNSKEKAA